MHRATTIYSRRPFYAKALPACLSQARNIAPHGSFTQFVSAQTKLTVYTVRTPGNLTAATLSAGTGIPWHFLQFENRLVNLLKGTARTLDYRFQLSASGCIPGYRTDSLCFTSHHAFLGHKLYLTVFSSDNYLKGKLKPSSKARPSSSVLALVVIVISIPRNSSILSYSISGNMICSLTPIL